VVRALRDRGAVAQHEFEPWQWGELHAELGRHGILVGSFGWFFMWFLLFVKQIPVIAIMEVKEIVAASMKHAHARRAPLMQGVLGEFQELDTTCRGDRGPQEGPPR
jgi:hypothetical protein